MAKKMGRPLVEIDQKEFEGLMQIQCTELECLAYFRSRLNQPNLCEDTLNAWCKRTYGKTFSEVSKEKKEVGKIGLRRTQFRLAQKSATMAIFLGKQILGQQDRQDLTVTNVSLQDIIEGADNADQS